MNWMAIRPRVVDTERNAAAIEHYLRAHANRQQQPRYFTFTGVVNVDHDPSERFL